MALVSKSNNLALVGSLLIIVSSFLTFSQVTLDRDVIKYTLVSDLLNTSINLINLVFSGEFSLSLAVLYLVFGILGLATLFGCLVTVFFLIRKHSKTALCSLVVGICGLSFFIFYLRGGIANIAEEILGIGFYLFIVGVICLLLSGGTTFFKSSSLNDPK